MINLVRSILQDPRSGWDPIPPDYARSYERSHPVDPDLVERLDQVTEGLAGRRILDLGSGPGQYAVEFARRGATVVAHDVSRCYLALLEARAREAGVEIQTSLGYLEEARHLPGAPFDIVFCSLCWCYSRSDRRFAREVVGLVRPGGLLYVDTTLYDPSQVHAFVRPVYAMNNLFGFKVGHPWPPPGRVARLLRRHPHTRLDEEHIPPNNDRVLFWKAEAT